MGLERVDLAAVGVALDTDVQDLQQRLAPFDLIRQDDHPGARPQHRHARGNPLSDRLDESIDPRQPADGGRFPPGDGQAVDGRDLVMAPDQDGRGPAEGKHLRVLPEVALQGEDPRLHGLAYQPRVWRSSPSLMVATSRPRIGSPRDRETLARISGSL